MSFLLICDFYWIISRNERKHVIRKTKSGSDIGHTADIFHSIILILQKLETKICYGTRRYCNGLFLSGESYTLLLDGQIWNLKPVSSLMVLTMAIITLSDCKSGGFGTHVPSSSLEIAVTRVAAGLGKNGMQN